VTFLDQHSVPSLIAPSRRAVQSNSMSDQHHTTAARSILAVIGSLAASR
jgi:hypothetical protein